MQTWRRMRQILKLVLLFLLCCSPALAQGGTGARPSGFFPEPATNADNNATYFTLTTSTTLQNERLLTFTNNFTTTDNGAGNTYVVDLATVPLVDGGTGATTQQGAVNAILGFAGVAAGDITYFNGTNWVRLPKGSDTQILTLTSGLPTWSSASASAPANVPYITQALDATLSAERVLAGTANRITLTDGGANGNMTLDIGTDVVTLTGTQTLTNKTLTNPLITYSGTQAIGLKSSGAFTGSLIWADFPANRTLTIPDPGGNASFVMTAGAQTIAGVKTFSNSPVLSTNTITGSGANTVTLFTSSDTVVGRATTDTLTNKTLTAPSFTASSLTLKQSSFNYTVSWANPAAARAYTIRDVGTDAHFAMTNTAMTYTNGGAVYIGSGVMNATAAGTSGQPLLSGGTGAPAFNTLGATAGGTSFTTYATGDTIYASAANTLSKRTIGNTGDVYTVAGGVPTWAPPATGTTALTDQVQGRLSLNSSDPINSGGTAGAVSVFFVPYKGNRISLYNGSTWNTCTFSAITGSLSGLTANKNYDVFVYDSNADKVADTLDLVVWSTDTARVTNLATQDGVYVKSGATGRRYVGTIRITATTGQCESSPTKRYVWNYYNRIDAYFADGDTTDTWTYALAAFRVFNNDSTNNRLEFVCGVAEDPIFLYAISSVSGAQPAMIGIGMDSTTTPNTTASFNSYIKGAAAGDNGMVYAQFNGFGFGAGYHAVYPLESAPNATSVTFMGDNGISDLRTGIAGTLPM